MGAPVSAPRSACRSSKKGMAFATTKEKSKSTDVMTSHHPAAAALGVSTVCGEREKWMSLCSGCPVTRYETIAMKATMTLTATLGGPSRMDAGRKPLMSVPCVAYAMAEMNVYTTIMTELATVREKENCLLSRISRMISQKMDCPWYANMMVPKEEYASRNVCPAIGPTEVWMSVGGPSTRNVIAITPTTVNMQADERVQT
mmetsp:Transcript_49244/g.110768  ORF Transcript_49244/g.110768 Transcript_49244/m.110768 type:complete len:201 (-) Transcript_49244:670-1272(-)